MAAGLDHGIKITRTIVLCKMNQVLAVRQSAYALCEFLSPCNSKFYFPDFTNERENDVR